MPLLEIRDLTKHFFRLSALNRVSLGVEPGELLGIIGPNGSGKTTLFNCVTGVLRPSGGHVSFKGEDITGLPADAVYRRGVARTFQLIQIFPAMTVLENMLMAAQERKGTLLGRLCRREEVEETRRAIELLDYLGIAAARDQLAGLHADTHPAQRGETEEVLRQVPDLEERHPGSPALRARRARPAGRPDARARPALPPTA